jgi:hypothetical protein
MFHSRQNSRRLTTVALALAVVGLLLVPGANLNHTQLKSPTTIAKASVSKSYADFITAAYIGAYGRYPDCATELQPEYDQMVYAASQNALLAECQRFVATLFETQASFDAQDFTTYTQTYEYEQRNAASNSDLTSRQNFVTDLYEAFLQRNPDTDGRDFWTYDALVNGRKHTIVAFEVCTEFSDLVDSLYAGDRPDCGDGCGFTCEPGYHMESCECIPNCSLRGHPELCD